MNHNLTANNHEVLNHLFVETNIPREDQGTYLDLLLNILINFLHAD